MSPNGKFRVQVTDAGIYLRGPRGTYVNNPFGLRQSTDPFAR